jgi:sulfate/thiosulfate transport system permease protein
MAAPSIRSTERTRESLPPAARHVGVLPGFGLTLGFSLTYLALLVLLPLAALVIRPWELGVSGVWQVVSSQRTLAALRTSFGIALLAAAVNVVFGMIVAWVVVRYRFWGRPVVNALIDLPFALPTAVAGVALAVLYSPRGWLGAPLAEIGIKAAFGPPGIFIALVFIGLPFVVRTVEPVLEDLDREVEEAASTLGAARWQVVSRVVLPPLAPAILTGFILAFARAVGEYGSVIFIAGNIPGVSEIAPLLIVIRLEEYNYAGAAAIGAVMLAASFVIILIVNLLQRWSRKWAE